MSLPGGPKKSGHSVSSNLKSSRLHSLLIGSRLKKRENKGTREGGGGGPWRSHPCALLRFSFLAILKKEEKSKGWGSSLFPPFLSASPSCRWLGLYRSVGVWEGREVRIDYEILSPFTGRPSSFPHPPFASYRPHSFRPSPQREPYAGQRLLSTAFWLGRAKRDTERRLKASFIMTCVGSVAKATLRLANATALNTNEALGRAARRTRLSLRSRNPQSRGNGAGDKLSRSMSSPRSLRSFIDSGTLIEQVLINSSAPRRVVLFGGFSWAAKRQGGHMEGLDTPCLLILTESLISANWVGQFKQARQSGVSCERDTGANRQATVVTPCMTWGLQRLCIRPTWHVLDRTSRTRGLVTPTFIILIHTLDIRGQMSREPRPTTPDIACFISELHKYTPSTRQGRRAPLHAAPGNLMLIQNHPISLSTPRLCPPRRTV
ncbi:hypothetical protein E1301_Tti006189 [Triplophysa tibetana]|uniref:Uncharacterized protein n=1 Tax=Triplophysa tibetana TaxID=1572043 RepID=A0A5A9NP66_9TELE|nr:hypothetical protein E1301_Tti006189 [Triplophysa tibetana]